MKRSNQRGVVLLEVLSAVVLLAAGGLTLVSLLAEARAVSLRTIETEKRLLEADRVLTAMSLLTLRDLDRRLGRYEVAGFMVEVQRPRPTLYRIALAEPATPDVELLVTVVSRRGRALP